MNRMGTMQLATPTEKQIIITRIFDAPRQLVFDAHTKPELLKRWLNGAPGWSLAICDVDLRVGGVYRYVWRGPNGEDMGMGGTYLEVAPPERIVTTQLFDQDWTGGEVIGTLLLIESNGQTTLTNTLVYSSKESRDAVLRTPMDKGMSIGYDQLETLLPTLA